MFRSTLAIVLASGLVACGAAPVAKDDSVEIVDTSPLALEASPLIGRWRSANPSRPLDSAYATELVLADDATFEGQMRRAILDGERCTPTASEPCIVAVRGKWRLSADGQLQFRVVKGGHVSEGKTLTVGYHLARATRVLTLSGDEGEQTLAEHVGCEGVVCGAGRRCDEQANGAVACVVIPSR